MANFGLILRGSVTDSMLITAFVSYLIPRLSGVLYQVWTPKPSQAPIVEFEEDPSDSQCNALTHLSMPLGHKYINLKELYNQGIKECVKKRREVLHEIPNSTGTVNGKRFLNSILYL